MLCEKAGQRDAAGRPLEECLHSSCSLDTATVVASHHRCACPATKCAGGQDCLTRITVQSMHQASPQAVIRLDLRYQCPMSSTAVGSMLACSHACMHLPDPSAGRCCRHLHGGMLSRRSQKELCATSSLVWQCACGSCRGQQTRTQVRGHRGTHSGCFGCGGQALSRARALASELSIEAARTFPRVTRGPGSAPSATQAACSALPASSSVPASTTPPCGSAPSACAGASIISGRCPHLNPFAMADGCCCG